MGVFGLTQLVEKFYLEDYELQNTDLVIDGNDICHSLCDRYCKCIFGGDYDKYDRIVSDFFDHLLQSNIKPLVLFQGGCYESKLPTALGRLRQRIQEALEASPENQKCVTPIFLKTTFIQVLRMKDIPHAQCMFGSDNSIAVVAKALNCPILSNASNFYLYGVLCIPTHTLLDDVTNHLNDNRKSITCKIYRRERLLNNFKGLNQYTLSLIAVLLPNDNIQLQQMVRKSLESITQSKERYCLPEVLRWLCTHTLEDAVTKIVKEAPIPIRPQLLRIIESSINKYTNPFAEVFTHLSIPEECFTNSTEELYKFKGNVEALLHDRGDNEQTSGVVEQRENYIIKTSNKLLQETRFDKDLEIDKIPQWFKYEISLAKFSGYFMEIVRYHYLILPIMVENFNLMSSSIEALPIYKVMFELLTSVTQNQNKTSTIKYVIRSRNSFAAHNLLVTAAVPLSDIRALSLSDRKKFLDNVLGIKDVQFIEELLPKWQLYIAAFQYWRTCQRSKYNIYHLYSILTCMIYKLTVSKIGYYSSLEKFVKSNGTLIESFLKKRGKSNIKPKYTTCATITQACKEIDTLDCLLVAPFFIRHSEIQPDLSYGDKFDRNILHAFSEFQFCLVASFNLNTLLDFPYEEPMLANLYNGTLLYNLYVNFQRYADIDAYKNIIFNDSPSLLSAFNALFKLLEK